MLALPQHVAVLPLEAVVAVAHGPEALDVQVLQHLVHILSIGLGRPLAPARIALFGRVRVHLEGQVAHARLGRLRRSRVARVERPLEVLALAVGAQPGVLAAQDECVMP